MDVNALLKKVATAESYSNADNIKDGIYTLSVKKIELTDKGWFVVNFRVDESTAKEKGVEPNAVGTTCKTMSMLMASPKDVKYASHPGNVKTFITALVGQDLDPDQFASAVGLFIGPKQAAKGMKIKCETTRKDKKTSEGQFTALSFIHIKQADDEIDANAATL